MILDGKAMAAEFQAELRDTIAQIQGRKPCLAVVLVGQDPASQVYVRRKKKCSEEVGIRSVSHELPDTTTQEELLHLIDRLNKDAEVDGILVQSPFPSQIDPNAVMNAVDPAKDVDGFHPENMGRVLIGSDDGFIPCTPLGIKVLLERSDINIKGKHIVIVGRGNIVGKPLAALLIQRGRGRDATVTIVHRASERLEEICASADVLVSAIGVPRRITANMVKKGAVVIDVGINRVEDSSKKSGFRLCGDVDFDAVKDKCRAITPVPGGVGPMTIAMLLHNTLLAFERNHPDALPEDFAWRDAELNLPPMKTQ